MLNTLTYQQKCSLLLIIFIMFIVSCYHLSFKKTIALRYDITEKEKKIAWLQEKEKEIPFLRSKMALIERSYNKDSISIRDQLTEFISDHAENNSCLVTEIPKFSTYAANNLHVQTNIFTIKGTFNPLLQLIQSLEIKFKSRAKLMSLHFLTVKEFQTKRKNLYLTLVTQSFSQNDNQEKHE